MGEWPSLKRILYWN